MKFLSTLIIFLSIISQVLAQTCLPDGITITHQSTIDNFPDNYPGCQVILGDLIIDGIDIDVANVDSLYSVTEIQGDLIFGGNDFLLLDFESLEGFNSLTTIGGQLRIEGLAETTTLEGLNNLESIGGNLVINANIILEDISSLISLTQINGILHITSNEVLNSLSGIENINHSGIEILYLFNNPLISYCNYPNICTYLELNTALNDATINNNLEGCNSIDEVLNECSALNIENKESKPFLLSIVNPVKNRLKIIQVGVENELQLVKIISLNGNTILSTNNIISNASIDVSHLYSGLYILELVFADGTIETRKMVKL